MKTSIIFTTYNSTSWLEKVLWGFFVQTVTDFEIIIADDGSDNKTRELIEKMQEKTSILIKHIWQEDNGFQKCRILNKAILASEGEYLIFTDGDCIPRNDFVEQHLKRSEPNTYLSGGYFKLPISVSKAITSEDILSQRTFNIDWLVSMGLKKTHKAMKLTASTAWANVLNKISPARSTWNGHSASCYKKHILAVNGFEETMQYGGQDCEFGDRLINYGLKAKCIRYSAICVHLDHKRAYITSEMLKNSKKIRMDTKKNNVIKARVGLYNYN